MFCFKFNVPFDLSPYSDVYCEEGDPVEEVLGQEDHLQVDPGQGELEDETIFVVVLLKNSSSEVTIKGLNVYKSTKFDIFHNARDPVKWVMFQIS
jgi:hypothetical protein